MLVYQVVFGTYGLLMISDFLTMKFIEILKDTGSPTKRHGHIGT